MSHRPRLVMSLKRSIINAGNKLNQIISTSRYSFLKCTSSLLVDIHKGILNKY